MNCPKCREPFETVRFGGHEVDRCTGCRGLWLGMLEAEHLEGAESIDIGDPKVGKQFDKQSAIECPDCHTRMIRMVDRDQPHIHFEPCKVCYGVFLDAGEFLDLKTKTVADYVRDFLARFGL